MLSRDELKLMAEVIKAGGVEPINVPELQPETELTSLLEGLPTVFGIGIDSEDIEKKLYYFLTGRSLQARRVLSQIFDIVHKVSPDLAVKTIDFRQGSLWMIVYLKADGWIRSHIGADYDPLAPISTYLKSQDALHQLNADIWRAAEAIKENFADFFQDDTNP